MSRKKVWKITSIAAILIVLICVMFNIKAYNSQKKAVKQIENIVKSCAIGDIKKSNINKQYGEKIYDCIHTNWLEEGGIKITQIECDIQEENWKKNYIWMAVSYKGELKDGKKVSESEYFKIFFKSNGDEVYVIKIGVSIGEDGISDLDSYNQVV